MVSQHTHIGPLEDRHREQFARDGYTVVSGIFTDQDLALARAGIAALKDTHRSIAVEDFPLNGRLVWNNRSEFVIAAVSSKAEMVERSTRIQRVAWAGGADARLLTFGRNSKLVATALKLLQTNEWSGSEVQHLISSVHFKEPGDGVEFKPHQDIRSRRDRLSGSGAIWNDINMAGSFVNCVTAIDPFKTKNGPVFIVPYSRMETGTIGVDLSMELRESDADLDRMKRDWQSFGEAVELDAGDTIFFSPYVVHWSEPNTSDMNRWATVNGFAVPGASNRFYVGGGEAELDGPMVVLEGQTGKPVKLLLPD